MRANALFSAAIAAGLIGSSVARGATVINFDDFNAGTTRTTFAANRYQSLGVDFTTAVPIYNISSNEPTFTAAYTAGGGTLPNTIPLAGSSSPVSAFFVVPGTTTPTVTNLVQIFVGDTEVGSTLGTLNAFNSTGGLIAQATMTTPASETGVLSISTPGIASVTFYPDADGADFDNLTFNVPEPTTLAVVAAIGSAWAGRRRR